MMRCCWLCWMLLAAVGTLGCDAAPDAELPELVQPAKAQRKAEEAKSIASPQPPASAVPDKPEFEAPFPPRENPFTLPPRGSQPLAAALPGVSEAPLRILLKGFVTLDTPRAVLTIDDEVVSLGVGEEHRGVKVVTLAPPQVILQRGRYRWTESLEHADASAK